MKTEAKSSPSRRSGGSRPPMSPEAHENLCIGLAMDLAEKQLREGTASAQVISHFLKMGSPKEQLERELLVLEKDLTKAKKEELDSRANMEQTYKEALEAMRSYTSSANIDEADDVDED